MGENATKKIFNLTARLELKCGGDEFQGEEHSAVRSNRVVSAEIRQLQNQNNKKKEKQIELIGGVQPRRHIFFRRDPSNMGEVRCRRPQCWLCREPRNMTTWPTLQRAEYRQTRTKNEHQVRAAGEIPLLEAEGEELCRLHLIFWKGTRKDRLQDVWSVGFTWTLGLDSARASGSFRLPAL